MTLTSWRSSRNCAYSDIQLSRCNPSHISNVYTQQIVQQVGVKQVKRQCESESKEEFSQKRRRGKWLFSVRGKRTWTHKPEMSNHLLLVLKSFSSDYVLCVFEFKMNDFFFLYIFFFNTMAAEKVQLVFRFCYQGEVKFRVSFIIEGD